MLEYYSAEFRIFHTLPICEVSVSSKSDVRGRDSFEKPTNNSVKKNDDSPRRNRSSDDSIINAMIVFRRIKMCI